MGKTATQAAKELGCCVATVTRYAREMNLGRRHGYAFVLTDAEINKIRKSVKLDRGCKPRR